MSKTTIFKQNNLQFYEEERKSITELKELLGLHSDTETVRFCLKFTFNYFQKNIYNKNSEIKKEIK